MNSAVRLTPIQQHQHPPHAHPHPHPHQQHPLPHQHPAAAAANQSAPANANGAANGSAHTSGNAHQQHPQQQQHQHQHRQQHPQHQQHQQRPHHPTPSPSLHQSPLMHPSPSTVEASTSPLQAPSALQHHSAPDAVAPRADAVRMRSQVACARCRRSKTKCDNKGPDTTCKSCLTSNKVCEYPINSAGATTAPSQRRESAAGSAPNDDGPPRKRKRNLVTAGGSLHRGKEGLGTSEDALNSPLLTPKVWKELFEIYEKHFATDFPFLHKRTFLSPLQQLSSVSSPGHAKLSHSKEPRHYNLLLLAFLTQTSRYHPELIAQTEGPLQTAEFYADATRKQLGYDFTGDQSLEKIQALLMLGYHEWTGLLGQNGWVKIRIAISCAQALGYQYDEELDDRGDSSKNGEELSSEQDQFIRHEIRRRTFWSCFILDRYLSVGRNRPLMLNVKDLGSIQLPCSDTAFNHGRSVKTRIFGEDDEAYEKRREKSRELAARARNGNYHPDYRTGGYVDDVRWEVGEHEEALSRYIHVVDHFSDVMKWSNKGGRRSQGNLAPWNPETAFYHLEERLLQLKRSLPVDLQLTPRNTEVHIYTGTSRVYVLMHAFLMLSTVALYREYIAFSPWRVTTPQGPLDDPKVTEPLPRDRPNYWVEQACDCFGAVNEFSSILQACQAQALVVESPIAGFATYLVAWCALYCHYFPRMDPKRALNSKHHPSAWDLSNEIILGMSERFQIALQWQEDLTKLQRHWREERIKYKEAGGSPESTTSDSGGGLKEYSAHFEKSHKEFGSLNNSSWSGRVIDRSYTKLEHDQDSDGRTAAPSPEVAFKSERGDTSEDVSSATPVASFTAVNATTQSRSDTVAETSSYPPTANPTPNNVPQIPSMAHTETYPSYTAYSQAATYPPTAPTFPVDPRYQTPQQHVASSNGGANPNSGVPYDSMWQQQQINATQLTEIEWSGSRGVTNSDLQNYMTGTGHTGDPACLYPMSHGLIEDWYGSLQGQGGYSIQ